VCAEADAAQGQTGLPAAGQLKLVDMRAPLDTDTAQLSCVQQPCQHAGVWCCRLAAQLQAVGCQHMCYGAAAQGGKGGVGRLHMWVAAYAAVVLAM
jgi:hypothetical protein